MSRFYPVRVTDVKRDTRDAVVVTLDVAAEHRDAFAFTQGQHLTLRAMVGGAELRRSYSICSAPHDPHLRIAIKRVDDGLFSNWAHTNVVAGHVLDVMPPQGNFHVPLEPASSRHHVAFAAGSGITPVLSILRTTLQAEPLSRFTLVYGNRSSGQVLFKEELEALKDTFLDRLNLVFVLSREHQDIDLFNGRIDRAKVDALLTKWIDPADIDVAYICGPESMMTDVRASLLTHGVEAAKIKMEMFGTAGERAPRAARAVKAAESVCTVTVVQDGRQRSFTFATKKDQTLLDAALEQGVELPYSCKGGVCSTCRCKLTGGEVEMDAHFALEDYEVARGFILTCQSFALSDALVLDFDQET